MQASTYISAVKAHNVTGYNRHSGGQGVCTAEQHEAVSLWQCSKRRSCAFVPTATDRSIEPIR